MPFQNILLFSDIFLNIINHLLNFLFDSDFDSLSFFIDKIFIIITPFISILNIFGIPGPLIEFIKVIGESEPELTIFRLHNKIFIQDASIRRIILLHNF